MSRTEDFIFKTNQEDLIKIIKHDIKCKWASIASSLGPALVPMHRHCHGYRSELEEIVTRLKKLIGDEETYKFLDDTVEEYLASSLMRQDNE